MNAVRSWYMYPVVKHEERQLQATIHAGLVEYLPERILDALLSGADVNRNFTVLATLDDHTYDPQFQM